MGIYKPSRAESVDVTRERPPRDVRAALEIARDPTGNTAIVRAPGLVVVHLVEVAMRATAFSGINIEHCGPMKDERDIYSVQSNCRFSLLEKNTSAHTKIENESSFIFFRKTPFNIKLIYQLCAMLIKHSSKYENIK